MAPQEKKWDNSAERDLCVAIIQGSSETGKVRYNWARVEEIMKALGHSFTKDAMSQHFSKTIMKEFRARHPEAAVDATAGTTETPPPSAVKPKAARKTAATPSKKRAKKGAKGQPDADNEEDDDVDDDASPTKKVKKEDKASALKKEESAEIQSADVDDDNDEKSIS